MYMYINIMVKIINIDCVLATQGKAEADLDHIREWGGKGSVHKTNGEPA